MSDTEKNEHLESLRQQTVLARFGELALRSDDVDEILTEACRLVGEALGTDLAKVMEVQENGKTLLVRAGVGWKPGVVGVATIEAADDTSESHALKTRKPMISPDINTETRFSYPPFLTENGVKAVVNVVIIGGKGRPPFGILQVDSRKPREFTDNDTVFLSSYANLLAAAVDRLRVIGQMRDTEARLRESTAALQANEARLRAIFETSYQFQGLLALDGTLLDANATSLEAIHSKLEDVVGKPFWNTPWFTGTPGMPEKVRAAVAAAATGEAVRREILVNLPTGSRSFDFAVRPIHDKQGAAVATVAEAVDITDRRQAEEALRQSQKMEAIGQLTGGIAHDFNNLLVAISGSLELIRTRAAQGRTAELGRYIEAALASANRAAALTHRLLAFSRRQTLDPKPISVDRLVGGMEDLFHRTVGPATHVEIRLAGELWPSLCDPNQLESALLNLVINARDAMPDGGHLVIETANTVFPDRRGASGDVPPGEYVALSVTDTGTGMSPSVAARAFDPFFTTKPLGQGTGLGLSMIYGFVQQSGGRVHLRSEEGQGTTLTIYLPRHFGAVDSEAVADPKTEQALAESSAVVLVVEDEVAVRMIIVDVLSDLGCAVLEAGEGRSGLHIVESGTRIDLLLTDVGLPGGMNGWQLADAARQRRPDLKVLFITGYAEGAAVGNGRLDEGMQVMTKPFTLDALAARVQSIISPYPADGAQGYVGRSGSGLPVRSVSADVGQGG